MTNQEKALELHEKLQGKLETVSKTPSAPVKTLHLSILPALRNLVRSLQKTRLPLTPIR